MYNRIKEESYEANMNLTKLGLVKFTFGNVSVFDRDKGVFAIKPSGVPYELLKAEDMVIVDLNAQVVEGNLRPSSDTKTHAVLYKEWPGLGAVVHTHSVYGTAWAQANRSIPIYGTTHADHLTTDIPCAPPMADEMIEGNYEYQTGYQIDHQEIQMILVGNHAPFTWGKDGNQAVYNAAVLEYVAELAYFSEGINPQIERLKASLIKKHYERKHGKDAYYGQ
jgi:L-ribulose-5-phosphate 4-epimerase